MATRRTPSGQGPSSRPRHSGGQRSGPARASASRRATPRAPVEKSPSRSEPGGRSHSGASGRPTVNLRGDAGRSAKRPATARRAAAPGGATRTAVRPPARISGRATALGLVVLALVLAYGYPLRLYLNQEAQIQRLEASQAAQRAQIAHLTDESAKYQDPAYIRALARARFQYVDPGVKGFIVLPMPVPPPAPTPGKTVQPAWYDQLWTSVRSADNPGAK
jgi:cell division protein FtsB